MKKRSIFAFIILVMALISGCNSSKTIALYQKELEQSSAAQYDVVNQKNFNENETVLYCTSGYILVQTSKDKEIRTISDEFVSSVPSDTIAFGAINDKFILARYDDGILIELTDGSNLNTGLHPIGIGISNKPSVEFASIKDELYIRIGNSLYLLNGMQLDQIYKEYRWESLVCVNDSGFAVVSIPSEENGTSYLLHIDETGFSCLCKKSWEGQIICMTPGTGLYLCSSNGLYYLEKNLITKLTGLLEIGLTDRDVYGIAETDGQPVLITSRGYCTLKQTEAGTSQSETVEITIGSTEDYMGLLSISLASFNQSQSNIKLKQKQYRDANHLVMDILTGNTPDLICTGSDLYQIELLAGKDVLLPISSFVQESFSSEEYFTNVLHAGSTNGEIYYITPFYQIKAFAAPTELVGDLSQINTLKEFEQIFEAADQDGLYCGMSQMDMLDNFISNSLHQFINYETLTSDFQTQEFYSLLEYCSRYVPQGQPLDLETFRLFQPSNIYSAEYLATRARVRNQNTPYGPEITYMSMPFTGKEGLAISGEYYIGISAQTEHETAAKEVLRYLLSEETQMLSQSNTVFMLPVLRHALPTYDESWPEMIPFAEKLLDIIERSDHYISSWLAPFQEIVREEASYYFAGVKTAEETASLIKDRVDLFLQEKK